MSAKDILEILRPLQTSVQRLETNNSYTVRQQQFDELTIIKSSLGSIHDKFDKLKKQIDIDDEVTKEEMEELFKTQFKQLLAEIGQGLTQFLQEFETRLGFQTLSEGQKTLDANIRLAHTMIDKAVNRLLTHLENENYSPVLTRLNEAVQVLLQHILNTESVVTILENSWRLQEEKLEKVKLLQKLLHTEETVKFLAMKLQALEEKIDKLKDKFNGSFYLTIVDEIRTIKEAYKPNFDLLSKDIQHLKIIQREPISQEVTHNKLNEINKQIHLLDISSIQKEVMKILEINLTQDEFTRKLAEAIRFDVRDRLVDIQKLLEEIKKTPTQVIDTPTQAIDTTKIEQLLRTIQVGTTSHTTTEVQSSTTYLLYSAENTPDKEHWII